ncbi:MAG TPA: DoxX family protein [Acidimicrobiia bacterium]|nr:DoxX family protein [Acidimicrobiia bacterium]
MTGIDVALLLLRLWAGIVIIAHGVNHGRTLEGTAKWFASKGFKSAGLNARISALNEIAIGVALIAGLLTSVAAAGLVATMFVAFWSIHRFVGFFNFRRPDEGYEYVATLAVIGTAVAIAGPGRYSVDEAIGIAGNLDGWVGAAIVGAGLLVAVGQLATFWRKPAGDGGSA